MNEIRPEQRKCEGFEDACNGRCGLGCKGLVPKSGLRGMSPDTQGELFLSCFKALSPSLGPGGRLETLS